MHQEWMGDHKRAVLVIRRHGGRGHVDLISRSDGDPHGTYDVRSKPRLFQAATR